MTTSTVETTTALEAPPAVIVDNRTTGERFRDNFTVKKRSASFWIASVGGCLVTILLSQWQSLDSSQQGALLGAVGLSKVWVPSAVLVVGYLAAALKPAAAGVLSPQAAAFAEQLARAQINAVLRRHGQAEVVPPAVAPALTTKPPMVLVAPPPPMVNGDLRAPAPVAAAPVPPSGEAPVLLEQQPATEADTVQANLAAIVSPPDGAKAWDAVRAACPGMSDQQIMSFLVRARRDNPAAPAAT